MIDYLHMGAIPVYVGVAFCEPSFKRELKRLKITKDVGFVPKGKDATVFIFERPNSLKTMIVCVNKPSAERSGVEIAGLLVHEAVHVWQHCLAQMGEYNVSSEVEAYNIQWISQFLFSKYVKRMLKS